MRGGVEPNLTPIGKLTKMGIEQLTKFGEKGTVTEEMIIQLLLLWDLLIFFQLHNIPDDAEKFNFVTYMNNYTNENFSNIRHRMLKLQELSLSVEKHHLTTYDALLTNLREKLVTSDLDLKEKFGRHWSANLALDFVIHMYISRYNMAGIAYSEAEKKCEELKQYVKNNNKTIFTS